MSSLGLPLLERGLEDYEDTYGHKMDRLGIVFTMVDHKTTLSKERMVEIASSGRDCFHAHSSASSKVAKSVLENISSIANMHRYAHLMRYGNEFKEITQEMLKAL